MKYQWILFDADETLFHFDAFSGLQRMFSKFGVDFTQEDFSHYQSVNQPLWIDYQEGRISALELQQTRFQSWAEKLSLSTAFINEAFLDAMAEICHLLPGADELILALKGQVKMGIITNGFTALQSRRLERTGLKDVFHPVVISEQVGVAKPDVAIFDYAFERMGTPDKNTVLMVGDNVNSDILGGINAGIDTCWLNTSKQAAPAGIKANYEVQSLDELKTLLVVN